MEGFTFKLRAQKHPDSRQTFADHANAGRESKSRHVALTEFGVVNHSAIRAIDL